MLLQLSADLVWNHLWPRLSRDERERVTLMSRRMRDMCNGFVRGVRVSADAPGSFAFAARLPSLTKATFLDVAALPRPPWPLLDAVPFGRLELLTLERPTCDFLAAVLPRCTTALRRLELRDAVPDDSLARGGIELLERAVASSAAATTSVRCRQRMDGPDPGAARILGVFRDRLEELVLLHDAFNVASETLFAAHGILMPRLRALHLHKCALRDLAPLAALPALEELSVSSPEGYLLEVDCAALKDCARLRRLRLRSMDAANLRIPATCRMLALEDVELAQGAAAAFEPLPELEHLAFDCRSWGFLAWADLLSKVRFERLLSLVVGINDIGLMTFVALEMMSAQRPRLVVLHRAPADGDLRAFIREMHGVVEFKEVEATAPGVTTALANDAPEWRDFLCEED